MSARGGNMTSRAGAWFRALRPHQWLKNILVFVPAASAHRLFEREVALAATVAFLLFGMCASGTYLFNDLMDLDADRRHPTKRHRPFAAGQLPLAHGYIAGATLVGCALLLAAWMLGAWVFATLGIYVAASVWYSRALKRIAMVDVLTLAALYSIRVIGGSTATRIIPSFWLLAFTMFIFLSLATAKRYAELKLMLASGNTQASGRGYSVDDAPLLQSCGVATGYISVLVLALYVNSNVAELLYSRTTLLWLLCPLLLYWITRVWIKTSRGQMNDDPVVFALLDRPSLAVAFIALVLVGAAS
jgi:4-hydroxybenzoate polyprenyltransferase